MGKYFSIKISKPAARKIAVSAMILLSILVSISIIIKISLPSTPPRNNTDKQNTDTVTANPEPSNTNEPNFVVPPCGNWPQTGTLIPIPIPK